MVILFGTVGILLAMISGFVAYAWAMREVDAIKMAKNQLFVNTSKMEIEETSEFSTAEMIGTGFVTLFLWILGSSFVRPIKYEDFYGFLVSGGMMVVLIGAVVLFWVDLRTKMLPNRIIYPTALISLAMFAGACALSGDWIFMMYYGMGAVLALAYYGIIWFIFPRGMGFGDVRMATMLGGTIMFVNPDGLMVMLVGPWVLALVFEGLRQLLAPSFRRKAFAFGPWIVIGFIIAVFEGESISNLVMSLF